LHRLGARQPACQGHAPVVAADQPDRRLDVVVDRPGDQPRRQADPLDHALVDTLVHLAACHPDADQACRDGIDEAVGVAERERVEEQVAPGDALQLLLVGLVRMHRRAVAETVPHQPRHPDIDPADRR